MAHILKIEKVNPTDMIISDPRDNKGNQGKTMYLNIHDKPVRVQTPKMRAPFGVSKFTDEKSGNTTYSLQLSFQGHPAAEKQFIEIERRMFQYAKKNSELIFGVPKSADTVLEFFKTNVYLSPFHVLTAKQQEKEGKYARTLTTKLGKNEKGEFTANIYTGTQKEEALMTEHNYETVIPKGSEVRAILSCTGWIAAKKFGLTWRVEQLHVFPNMNKLVGFSFVDGEDTGSEKEDQDKSDTFDYKEYNGNGNEDKVEDDLDADRYSD